MSVTPRAALEKSLRFDWANLLHAAVELGAPVDVVEAMLIQPALENARPLENVPLNERAVELPLLTAINVCAPATTLLSLLRAYPGAARWCLCVADVLGSQAPSGGACSERHKLPLHAAVSNRAAPEVVAALIDAYPEAVHARFANAGMPLHLAAAAGAKADLIRLLIRANPGAAAEGCRNHGSGDGPLLLALRNGAPADSVSALIEAHPPAALGASNVDGFAPLFLALGAHAACPVAVETVAVLLAADSGAAARLCVSNWVPAADFVGLLPLHAAVRALAPLPVLAQLLAAHPAAAAAKAVGGKGWLPLHFACAALATHPEAYSRAGGVIQVLLEAHSSASRVFFPRVHRSNRWRRHSEPEYGFRGVLPLHVVLATGGPVEAVAALVATFPKALDVWFGAAPGEDPRVPPPADPNLKLPHWLAEEVKQDQLGRGFVWQEECCEEEQLRWEGANDRRMKPDEGNSEDGSDGSSNGTDSANTGGVVAAMVPCAVCGCSAEFSAHGERVCFCEACRAGCRLYSSYEEYVAKYLERRLLLREATQSHIPGDWFGNLPLHIAVIARAPAVVVSALLARPAAAAERNLQGLLPLHAACQVQGGSAEGVIALLLAANPGAARELAPFHGTCVRKYGCIHGCGASSSGGPPWWQRLLEPPPLSQSNRSESPPRGWFPLEMACMTGAHSNAVGALIAAHPEALRSGTALRAACLYKAPASVVSALLMAYPEAAVLPAVNGMLAIHFAAMRYNGEKPERERGWKEGHPPPAASAEVLTLLLAASPLKPSAPALTLAPNSGLARREPGFFRVMIKRELPSPFAIACGTRAGAEVVAVLLAADPGAAAHCSNDSDFFLCLFPVQLRDSARHSGATWLHALCADPETPGECVEMVLRAYPDAARVSLQREACVMPSQLSWRDQGTVTSTTTAATLMTSGELPLHLACLRGAPDATIPVLVASYPEAVCMPWQGTKYLKGSDAEDYLASRDRQLVVMHGAGKLPLELALLTESPSLRQNGKSTPPAAIGALLAAFTLTAADCGSERVPSISISTPSLPLSLSASCSVTPKSPWNCKQGGSALDTDALVAFLLEHGEGMVDAFSSCCDALGAAGALHATICAPNSAGRTPYNVAGPLCRAEIRRRLFLLGRFELQEVVHASATSRVLHAVDWVAGGTKGSPVALKFMRCGEHFNAELRARTAAADTPHCFLPVLASFSGMHDPAFAAELVTKGLGDFPWCLAMAAGDRSLEDVVAHESAAPGWGAEAMRACAQVADALATLHSVGMVHGDVKPRNVLRVGARYCLIDFDAAVAVNEEVSGKLSSAYAPPEAFTAAPLPVAVAHRLAAPAVDAWGLGATLFRLLQGATLVHATDADDAVDEMALRALAGWDEGARAAALQGVQDPRARNLLTQLLHPRPERRPALARAVQHPFFTGREAARLPGESAQWDVFLSYRVASDELLAAETHAALEARGLRVFWDKRCLVDGKPWREGFFQGLVRSRAFLPIVSRGALKLVDDGGRPAWGNWEALTVDSGVDNVLLEHRAALECFDRGLLEFVLPVFVGDVGAGGLRGAYFDGGCAPMPPSIVINALEAELATQLDRAGLGTPYAEGLSARAVFDRVKSFQGKFLEGNSCIGDLVGGALENALRAGSGPGGEPGAASACWEAHADGSGRVWFAGPAGKVSWALPEGAQLAPPRVLPPLPKWP